MSSGECYSCGGSGMEKIVEIRGNKIVEYEDYCRECDGAGGTRQGQPDWTLGKGRAWE